MSCRRPAPLGRAYGSSRAYFQLQVIFTGDCINLFRIFPALLIAVALATSDRRENRETSCLTCITDFINSAPGSQASVSEFTATRGPEAWRSPALEDGKGTL